MVVSKAGNYVQVGEKDVQKSLRLRGDGGLFFQLEDRKRPQKRSKKTESDKVCFQFIVDLLNVLYVFQRKISMSTAWVAKSRMK